MIISQTLQEALKKLRTTRPAKPLATLFDALFPESILVARRAPLLWDALALFEEHWTAANGAEVQIHAHNAVDLLRTTAAEWRTDILRAKASAAHAMELQTQVSTL